jgi:hypothetical protein
LNACDVKSVARNEIESSPIAFAPATVCRITWWLAFWTVERALIGMSGFRSRTATIPFPINRCAPFTRRTWS